MFEEYLKELSEALKKVLVVILMITFIFMSAKLLIEWLG
jgi:hypothetical protein